ncbi:MAG TPA: Fic family protein [Cellulomonadaceae bacterium]|nr:Fic family protein [Cellulomonadaceae bacterium]
MQVRGHSGGLRAPRDAPGAWDELRLQEAHASTALAGNPLSRHEVEKLLNDGGAVGDHLLADYLEVTGYAQAAAWVHSQARDAVDRSPVASMTLAEVRQLHRLALRPAWDVARARDVALDTVPGTLRARDVRPFAGWLRTPSFATVEQRLADWIDVANAAPTSTTELIDHVAVAHARFEQLHPFVDGNGRVGRLLVNLVLVRNGHAPVIVAARDRTRYTRALRQADTGDHGSLAELFARSVLDNASRIEAVVQGSTTTLVGLTELERPGVSRIALRNAAQRGRLRAARGDDGHWRSCPAWVDEYLADRYVRVSAVRAAGG